MKTHGCFVGSGILPNAAIGPSRKRQEGVGIICKVELKKHPNDPEYWLNGMSRQGFIMPNP
jgi:hypothetical protein